jgi:hypothetical protein
MAFRQIKSPALADKAVINTKLDESAVQGQSTLTGMVNPADCFTLLYDVGSDSLKKIGADAFFASFSTDDLSEGSNLYYTSARANADVAAQIDADVLVETNRAKAAEQLLQQNIDAEASTRAAADVTLQANITAEETRATLRENAIETAFQAADTALGTRIDNIMNNTDPGVIDSFAEIIAAFEAADDVLSASIIANSTAITNEVIRAVAKETEINDRLSVEISRAQSAESSLAGLIGVEETARIAADNALSARLDTEETTSTSLQAQITAEVNRATSAESVLTQGLADEVTRATAAEAANASNISDEISARAVADTQVRTDLGADIVTAENAAKAHAEARDDIMVGDSTVDGTSGNTVTDRIATAKAEAIVESSNNVAIENAARIAGDSDLGDRIDAEILRATAQEIALQSNIDTEEAARIAGDSDLQSQVDFITNNTDPAALDSLTEIVSAFQSSDSDMSALISSNTTAISNEATTRASADTTLQSNIDTEASTRSTADTNLQSQIDQLEVDLQVEKDDVLAEAKAYTDQEADAHQAVAIAHADAQDAALIGDASVDGTSGNTVTARIATAKSQSVAHANSIVASEAATRQAADDALSLRTTVLEGEMDAVQTLSSQNEIDLRAEEVARASGDSDLQAQVDALNANTTIDVDDLQAQITAEVNRASAAEGVNAASVVTEKNRAEAVEAGLRTDVNTNIGNISSNLGKITVEETRAKAAEAALSSRLDAVEDDFNEADSDLNSAILAEVVRASGVEAGLRTDVDSLQSQVTDNDSDILALQGALGTDVSDLQNQLDAEILRATGVEGGIRTDLTTLEGRVDYIVSNEDGAALDSLTEIVSAFQDADSDLNGVIGNNSGRLSDVENRASVLEVRATDLEARATAVEGRATALESEQLVQNGRLTVNESDIDSLQAKQGSATLQTVATDLSAAINELHAELDVEVGDLTSLETRVGTAEGKISTLESEMDAVEVKNVEQDGRLTVNENDIDALEAKLGTGAFDTAAQTITGAVNEVHGELDAVEGRMTAAEANAVADSDRLTQEIADRVAGDLAIRADLGGFRTIDQADYIARDAVVLASAQTYAEAEADDAEAAAKIYADGIVSNEATLRENADNVLDARIDQEILDRQVADNGLDSRTTVLETEMSATQLGAGLSTQGTYVTPTTTNYLNASTSLADADAKLDAAIKAVDNTRNSGINNLQAQIDAEVLTRTLEDSDIRASLATEVARATGVESDLGDLITTNASAIAAESTRAQGVEGSLQTQINFITSNTDSAALDSLTEIVAAINSADGDLLSLIQQNQTDIAQEIVDRAAQGSAIRGEFAAADTALQVQIDARVKKSGDSMSGNLDMSGNKVEGVANGTVATDAVNKGQLDAGLAAQHISQFTTDDVAEGDNLYYTASRARSAVSLTDVSGEGKVSYTPSTGVFSVDTAKTVLELTDITDSAYDGKNGYVLRVNNTLDGMSLQDPTQLAFNNAQRQTMAGDGAQTTFALNFYTQDQNAIVFVGGVIQDPGVHYTIDAANQTITFNAAIPVGTQAVVIAQSTNSVGVLDPKSVGLETLADNIKVFEQGNDVVAGTTATTVSAFNKSTYRSAKYVVTVENGGEFETRECLVIHDGTNVYITEYGILFTGSSVLGDTDVRIVGNTVELLYTAETAGAVVSVSATYVDA